MTERRTPNDQTTKGTEHRTGLNTKFERRNTERRKIFHTIYEGFLSSVVIPQIGSFDPTWGMTTELKNLNFKHSQFYPQL
jgi:hypothetical protein